MSAFLGHIHHWLYEKIRLVTEREKLIYEAAGHLCGDTAEEVREQVYQTYGYPLPDKDLADLIDQTNIHGWLQRQIQVVETREAAAVQGIIEQCGSAGQEAIEQVFTRHGQKCGKAARDSGTYDVSGAPGLYAALNDFRLNGMPCDQNDAIIATTPAEIIWHSRELLSTANWRRAGADADAMQGLTDRWIEGFIMTANGDFSYRRNTDGTTMVQRIIRQG